MSNEQQNIDDILKLLKHSYGNVNSEEKTEAPEGVSTGQITVPDTAMNIKHSKALS